MPRGHKKHCQTSIQYLQSYDIRKDAEARELQINRGIENGLISAWSCVESCKTYKASFNREDGLLRIKYNNAKRKHLYFYYDHADFGFMSIGLQTWAPYEIQIALNGRQWLKRLLDKSGCKHVLEGNKFFDIDDYALAQQLLYSQLDTRWIDTFNGFLINVFPSMDELFGKSFGYYH